MCTLSAEEADEELDEEIENMFSISSLFYGSSRPAELLGGFRAELAEELDVFGTSSSSGVCTRPLNISAYIMAQDKTAHYHCYFLS